MTIQATELLQLLTKAKQLGFSINVHEDTDGDYVIRIFELFSPENFDDYLIINQKGESTCDKGAYSFYAMMDVLDEELETKRRDELKAQKRQELIDRLTDEEKELLNLK
jgi:hypothetical protein